MTNIWKHTVAEPLDFIIKHLEENALRKTMAEKDEKIGKLEAKIKLLEKENQKTEKEKENRGGTQARHPQVAQIHQPLTPTGLSLETRKKLLEV